MSRNARSSSLASTCARALRRRIETGGERMWRLADFGDFPATAATQALSRLARAGVIRRLSKGVYYRSRETALGPSRPKPGDLLRLAASDKAIFPAGTAAANLLGFSTQAAGQRELATTAASLPRKLVGETTIIHTRRPEAWACLSEADGALLDVLRRGGRTSELSPAETIARTLSLLSERGRFRRLLAVAATEPPRVRALLGALGQELRVAPARLKPLRESLNPISRFDFGAFRALPGAKSWQASDAEAR